MNANDTRSGRAARGILFAAVTVLAIAGPIAVGVIDAPRVEAQASAAPAAPAASAVQAALPTFEVASVKPTNTSGVALVQLLPGGRLRVTNFALQGLITRAWRVQQNQIDGGPGWIRSEGFDIEARAAGDASADEMWLMLKALLIERFKLRIATETRELPIYELSLARQDGKLGPSLKPFADTNCSRVAAGTLVAPGSTDRPTCGALYTPVGHWTGRETTIDSLASALTRFTGRVVVNRTGLVGKFDLDLEWTDLAQLLQPNNPAPPAVGGPSMETALREQLGLRLDSTKGPVDILVVQQAERPTPD